MVGYGYKKKSNTIQVLGLLLPIAFGGLRYNVGLDYNSYLNAYADFINPQVVDRYSGTSGLEYTFRIITHLSYFLFSSPIVMYIIYCAVTVIAFYWALTMMKPKKIEVALFFFYSIFFLNSFNIMRQGAAISIGCLALMHYLKGNRLKSLIYFLAAIALHTSALLLVLYVVLDRILRRKYTMKKKFTGIFVITGIISTGITLAGLKISAVGAFIYSITGRIGEFNPGLSMGVAFKYLICMACLYFVIYSWTSFNTTQKRLALLVAFGLIVYSLGLVYNQAARFGIYLIALTPILFATTYDNLVLRSSKVKLIMNSSLVFLCTVYIVAVHIGGGDGVQYEYHSVISSIQYQKQIRELGI